MTLDEMNEKLMSMALAYPQSYEENPWGERVVKVNGKIFLFSGVWKGKLGFSVKLPHSGAEALTREYASPTGYGMGKSGWVTMQFEQPEQVPMKELPAWLDESFRTIAPKWLIKAIDAGPDAVAEAVAARAAAAVGKSPVKTEKPDKKKSPARKIPVAVVGNDPRRLERARAALAEAGMETVVEGEPNPELLARIGSKKPRAVIIDLGRMAPHALEFARYLVDDLGGKIPIAFAGARDAAMEKRALAVDASVKMAARVPPGDPEFIAALLPTLK